MLDLCFGAWSECAKTLFSGNFVDHVSHTQVVARKIFRWRETEGEHVNFLKFKKNLKKVFLFKKCCCQTFSFFLKRALNEVLRKWRALILVDAIFIIWLGP